jgi:hypothetical protein
MDLSQLLQLLKQYGPVVGLLLLHVWWLTRRIDSLLERNTKIYDSHIQHLWETQQRLLTAVLGPQVSSGQSPTVDELKKKALTEGNEQTAPQGDKK